MRRRNDRRRGKAEAREWLAEASDKRLARLGLRGLEDVLVIAFGPDEDSQIFELAAVRAAIGRSIQTAAQIGSVPPSGDERSGR